MTDFAGANQTDYIAIAQLDPSTTVSGGRVRGIVTLIWPYSVSNQAFSILLAEPDFRLRRQRGQVRVQFRGSSAKALARCDVQSGDHVDLTLSHAQWEKEESASGTPGRGIEWELRFGERVVLQIQREDQEPIELDIDHPAPSPERRPRSPPPLDPSITQALPSTPVAFPPVLSRLQAWSTPAFLKRDRLSGISYFGSDYNPFDEDDFRDNNRRKKTKYGRASNQWRFTEQESSPESAAESKSPTAEPLGVNGVQNKTIEDEVKDVDAQALGASDIATQEKQNKEQLVSQGPLVDAGVQVEDSLMDQIPAGPSLHGSIASQRQSPALELIDSRKAVNAENTESLEHKTTRASAEIAAMSSPSLDNGPFDQGAANSGSDDAVYPTSSQGQPPEIKSHSIPSQADRRNHVELNEAAKNHNYTGGQESPGMEAGPKDIVARQPGLLLKESVDERSSQEIRSESSVLEENGTRGMGGVSESAVQVTLAQQAQEPQQHGFGSPQTAQDDVEMKSAIKDTEVAPALSFPSQEPVLNSHDHVDAGIAQESVKALFDTDTARALAISLVDKRRMKRISPTSHHVNTLGGEQDTESVLTEDLQGIPQLPTPVPEQLATSTAPSSQENEAPVADKIQREESMESGSEHNEQAWSPSPHVTEASEDEEEEFSEEDRMTKEESQERRASPGSVEGFRSETEDYSDGDMCSMEMPDEELESAQEEDDDEDQAPTAPQHSFAEQIITIDDSDKEKVDVARSQTDGAIVSALRETRQQSHPLGSLLQRQKTRSVIHSSPPPLPNTIPDSQAVAEAGEPDSDIESAATETRDINVSSYTGSPSVSEQRSGEDSDDPADGADIKSSLLTASLSPEIPLENYIDPRLKNKALTPSDTQPREAVSQTSHILSQSFQDAHDLPTPQLTQNRSSDILLPASLRLSSPAARSSSPSASVASSSPPLHDVETSELIDQHLVEQLTKAEDRNATIIALKPSPRARRVSNIPPSVSRWFAPRRSSEVVADSRSQNPAKSEDSDASDVSEQYADPKDIEVEEEEEDQTAEEEEGEEEEEEEEIPSSDIISPSKPAPSKSIFQRTSPTTSISTSTPPTGLRTSHAYYTPLSNLPSHFNTTTSTLSIVLASLPITRASSGPRDFYTTLFLTDPSSLQAQQQPPLSQSSNSFQTANLQTATFTLARLFRPSRISLPQKPKRGDVILLRSCAVTSYSRTASLLSSNSSAWALFSYGRHNTEPAIAGPPVEFGAEERGYVRGLWEWWEQLAESTKEGVMEVVDEKLKKMEEKEERERMKGRRLKGMGLRLAPGSKVKESGSGRHELRDGKEWSDDVAGKSTTPRTPRRSRGMRHELRDGKGWVDVEAPRTSRRS